MTFSLSENNEMRYRRQRQLYDSLIIARAQPFLTCVFLVEEHQSEVRLGTLFTQPRDPGTCLNDTENITILQHISELGPTRLVLSDQSKSLADVHQNHIGHLHH